MADFELPPEVAELVNRHLESMDHVEVLLRLWREPERWVEAWEIAKATTVDPGRIPRCLEDLQAAALVERRDDLTYRFAPARPADRNTVELLAQMYAQRPVTLVRAIYSRPPKAIRSFADAFRLRGD